MPLSAKVIKLSQELRRVAIEIVMPHAGKLSKDEQFLHSDGTSFTFVDVEAEGALLGVARKIYPDAIVTGEEDISENPDDFLYMAKRETVIIFDPIDGTGSFIRGDDNYAVMASVIHRGTIEAGIIYTPGKTLVDPAGIMVPEKDILVVAEHKQGCYFSFSPYPVSLAGRSRSLTEHARVAFACRNQDKVFESVLAQGVSGYSTRKSAGNDYTRLLMGDLDAVFYSEGYMETTRQGKCPPWDHAAGVLAVREAGGYAALPYGMAKKNKRKNDENDENEYNPLKCHDRLLVAANEDLFNAMYAHVVECAPELAAPRVFPD